MENKLGMGYTIDPNDQNIIDVEGIEIESTPVHEGDEVGMDRNGENGGWTKAPDVSCGAVNPNTSLVKVEKVEDIEESWLLRNGSKIVGAGLGIGIALLVGIWNKDKIADWFKDFGNDLTKSNTEDEQLVEPDYDTALAEAGATLEEQEQEQEQEPQVIEEGVIDKVIGDKVLAFTDPYDDDQVYTRANYINMYLQASNVNNKTNDELFNQTKFVCGTYNAATDDEAWDIYNDFLQTIADYSVAIEQSNNFAGGVVDDNGVHGALGLDAFLPDNCEHREIIDEISITYINLLTANTMGEKKDASKQMLKLEADLKEGMKETSNGTRIYFTSLTSSEGMIAGLMFQLSNAIIRSSFGENVEITYKDNMGQDNKVTLDFLETYYNPQCNGEYNTENVWAICCTDLVETAIAKGFDLTPSK